MSKQRNFRGRSKLSFDDNEEQEDRAPTASAAKAGATAGLQPPPAAAAARMPPKRDSRPTLLSFGDDDGPGPDQATKRKEKQPKAKIGRAQGLPELPATSAVPAAQVSAAGEYTAERLQELQKNARSFASAKFSLGNGGGGGEDGVGGAAVQQPVLRLTGSFKPAAAPGLRAAGEIDALAAPGRGPSPRPGSAAARPASPAAAALAKQQQQQQQQQRRGTPQGLGVVPGGVADGTDDDDDDGGSSIPDENMIRMAKAKRERLRQARLAPDYVPLGGASRLLSGSKPESLVPAGRPATEGDAEPLDGSDAEGDLEEHMRIRFTVIGAERAAERQGYAKTLSTGPEEDEQAFAEEQLRKAVRRSQAAMPAAATRAPGPAADRGPGAARGVSPPAGALTKSRLDAIASAGAAALAALRDGAARVAASHKAAQANLSRTSAQLTASLDKIERLEAQSKQASESYVYAQQLRAYIADLLDCLADKSAIVEELEEELAGLREGRAAETRDAARAMEAEMLRPAQAAVSAALSVLGRGGALPDAQRAAQAAANQEEAAMEDDAAGPPELDEFGRNVDLGKRREAQERRKQREALVAAELARLQDVAAGATPVHATDESGGVVEREAEVSRYVRRHAEIMDAAATVFADAAEEFASLGAVKRRLEDFKSRFPKLYANTYMHLSCPALFAPFVRLELLKWDPLHADAAATAGVAGTAPEVHKSFDKLAWYDTLFDYGMGSDPAAASADDPDAELVPQLVRKLVLPMALHLLRRCWDPLAVRHTQAAVQLVGDLLVYVPADEPAMAEVLDCVVHSLASCVDRVAIPAWPAAALAACPAAEAVLSLRFRAGLRLLAALGCWEGLLSRRMLQDLALVKVLSTNMLPGLRSAVGGIASQPFTAVARLEAAALALPAAWFEGGCPPEASEFVNLVVAAARALEAQSRDKQRLKGAAQRLAKALQRLGEQHRAANLAAAFAVML